MVSQMPRDDEKELSVRCSWEIHPDRKERKEGGTEGGSLTAGGNICAFLSCPTQFLDTRCPWKGTALGDGLSSWGRPWRSKQLESSAIAGQQGHLGSVHLFEPHVACSAFGQMWEAELHPAMIRGSWSSQLFVLCSISTLWGHFSDLTNMKQVLMIKRH